VGWAAINQLSRENVRFGSLADKPNSAKIRRCPLLSYSGHPTARKARAQNVTSYIMRASLLGFGLDVHRRHADAEH
jgi:hypothetical protein